MNRKIIPFQALGMAQDMSPSARPLKPSLAFENLNLRISTNDGNTLYSIVNERGTKSLSLISGTGWEEGDGRVLKTEILGTPIGTAVINDTMVVFTHNNITGEEMEAAIARREEILEELIPQAQSDISEKNAKIAEDEEELSEVNADIPHYESDLAQYQEELAGYTAKEVMFTSWCSDLREIKSVCATTIDFSDEESVTSLEDNIEALEQDITDYYYEEYGDDGSDEGTEWPQEMVVCKAVLNSIWNDLENTRQPKDDSDIDLNTLEDAATYIEENEISPLDTLINGVNSNIADTERNLQNSRDKKVRLENEIATLNGKIEKLNKDITDWRNELNTLNTTNNVDIIYLLKYSDSAKSSLKCVIYYTGCLGFNKDYPLETLVSYEAENIQKVYWTDGINQPRVINICRFDDNYNDDSFNFIRELRLQETVSVAKVPNGLGTFAPGVIQYAITYYTKYGQESNIAYTTPLHYISYEDRGASPEDRINIAFSIKILNVDTNFDYLRIYSIQRTSMNAVPICKRVTDIPITPDTVEVVYTDTGTMGDTIDPTELLYVGGTAISAYTMEQKDNTLFMGNIKTLTALLDSSIKNAIKSGVTTTEDYRVFVAENPRVSVPGYSYSNQLTSYKGSNYSKSVSEVNVTIDSDKEVPCGGFKRFNYYRIGVQFQYKTGAWSEPVFIKDHQITGAPEIWDGKTYVNGSSNHSFRTTVKLPAINGTIPKSVSKELIKLGYKRVRPVVVFPDNQDRRVICQGVVNPTIYNSHRYHDYFSGYWPSWFFRCYDSTGGTQGRPYFGKTLPLYRCDTTSSVGSSVVPVLRSEIQGDFHSDVANTQGEDELYVEHNYVTFHSPEIIFNEGLAEVGYLKQADCYISGVVTFNEALYALDIQTSTPVAGAGRKGASHTISRDSNGYGLVTGYWYEDNPVDDLNSNGDKTCNAEVIQWRIYPWQRSGSLNNDIDGLKGVRSSVLKTKVISNLWYTKTRWKEGATVINQTANHFSTNSVLWTGEDYKPVKLGDIYYVGHIDELLRNTHEMYYYDGANNPKYYPISGDFKADGQYPDGNIGDYFHNLKYCKDNIRIKYKTTGHLLLDGFGSTKFEQTFPGTPGVINYCLPIVEYLNPIDTNTIFGGNSKEALRQHTWLPCGEPVYLSTNINTSFQWSYGDTYYQRFDCLKTYPYTTEDENQIVDIGSFMLETYVNIDGRYDRNRGQMDNTNMSPTNFNLLNPVYSQKDNFFSYRITSDGDTQKAFPNQVTWTKTKQSGGDVDTWTNITLASILEMDGDKGKVTALRRKNNNLICFQDSGISQILYNENVQVASTEGVPIEIANSEKVLGKRYYTNTIGCSNKWSLLANDNGIYFMDSLNKALFMMTDTTTNLGVKGNMSVWIRNNMPAWSDADNSWTPTDHNDFVAYWDKQNQDILFINKDIALAWSEKLGAFTSFYSYGDTPYFCNLEDTGIWLRKKSETTQSTIKESVTLWQHNTGEYCSFFGEQKPYSTILAASSPEDITDKLFTNMEITASMKQEGVLDNTSYHPYMPFTSLESWTEYQHGIATLQDKEGTLGSMRHALSNNTAHLDRKFRTWRCDIPRDNYPVLTAPIAPIEPVDPTSEQQEAYEQVYAEYQEALAEYNAYLQDAENKGITRLSKHPLDRMRNPWVYLKLHKDEGAGTNIKAEIHSINVIYYQ